MSFHFHRHTFYTVLVDYMEQFGSMADNPEKIKSALENTESIIDYSLEKMDIAIDADGADLISKVGLQWLSYAKAHPDAPQGYAATAQSVLEGQ
ncbi:MAG: hypothetical protein ACTH3D_05590 [Halomonas sp.]|uniref:hypothetical protein n=1 Tax=Halomonas sp. TaxID=1486246 RepID=UPI003F8F0A80